MKNSTRDDTARLIEGFLIDHPQPTTANWKVLIEANPTLASDIVDAALLYVNSDQLEAEARTCPVNQTVYDKTISTALTLAHHTRSLPVEQARQRVNALKGPFAKNVAIEVGIGPHVSLLNGILVGRIIGPRQIIKDLSEQLEVSVPTLLELFTQAFQASEVPAYKATDGKPEVAIKPTSWEQAVRSLNLSADETDRLLKLDDQA